MFKNIDYSAWIATLSLIVLYRELSVWICSQFNHPELSNLIGLILLLISLSIVRQIKQIPIRLIDTNNKIMKESGFAFVPIAAGSCFAIFQLGNELIRFVIILFLSTLIPLWIYAKVAKKWL